MPIDFKSLKKLESLPAGSAAQTRSSTDKVEVLVKLRKGAKRPAFVTPRTQISNQIFSAEIAFGDVERLQRDPGVEFDVDLPEDALHRLEHFAKETLRAAALAFGLSGPCTYHFKNPAANLHPSLSSERQRCHQCASTVLTMHRRFCQPAATMSYSERTSRCQPR